MGKFFITILINILFVMVNAQTVWSNPINGLSASMTFEIEESATHAQIIHPKLNLRNETKDPIHFFWCIYDAGEFKIIDDLGNTPIKEFPSRSGPIGAEIITINPGQTVSLDCYDYGYGLSKQQYSYAFHTAFIQANLASGNYHVNYVLDYSFDELKKIVKKYDWIKTDIKTLWTGKIELGNIPMQLPEMNDFTTDTKANNQETEIIQMDLFKTNELTDLMIAARDNEDPQVIKDLIKAGADVNAKEMRGPEMLSVPYQIGRTPLMFAAMGNKNPEILRILLEAGAKIQDKTNDAWTALMFAAESNNNPEILEVLLKAGADVNATDNQGLNAALQQAVYNNGNRMEVAKVLLEAGASAATPNPERHGNLLTSVMNGGKVELELLDLLLEAGIDINARVSELKWTPLMAASWFSKRPEVIQFLLDKGADVHIKDKDGNTPLLQAAIRNKYPETIQILIEAGSDINVKNNEGKTALDLALKQNENLDVIQVLEQADKTRK